MQSQRRFLWFYMSESLLIITSDHSSAKMYFDILLQVIQKTTPSMKYGGARSFILA